MMIRKLSNDLISMKRKKISDARQWSNNGECVPRHRNCSMISFRLREKGHRLLVNEQRVANVMMIRDIVQWSHLDEKKKDIRCSSMIKHSRMLWLSEKLFSDLIQMKRKKTSNICESSNINECFHRKRNCSMISSRQREKGHRMLVNDQTLENVTLLKVIDQWSHLDEEKTGIGRWLMNKHRRMRSSSEKLFNDLISMKRKWISDVGQWPNYRECYDGKRNRSMISSRWGQKDIGC